jgi:hypothetical protein
LRRLSYGFGSSYDPPEEVSPHIIRETPERPSSTAATFNPMGDDEYESDTRQKISGAKSFLDYLARTDPWSQRIACRSIKALK